MDKIDLEIKNDALNEIASLAVKRKTGARGLRSIMEDILVDLMFETPDQKDLTKVIINNEVVKKKIKPILMFSEKNNQKIAITKT
jgi:ATP-dependent Clp protease ATP-binding subunit ClpX